MRCFLRASNNAHRLYVIVIVVALFRHFLAFPGLAQWKKEALELCSSWDKFFVFQLSENLRPTFEAEKYKIYRKYFEFQKLDSDLAMVFQFLSMKFL